MSFDFPVLRFFKAVEILVSLSVEIIDVLLVRLDLLYQPVLSRLYVLLSQVLENFFKLVHRNVVLAQSVVQ